MASWSTLVDEAPGLADRVLARFEATGLAFMATLRRDGSPRLSGIEQIVELGEVWLGMMEGSRKAEDLRRDPRAAIHAATVDKDVREGDAKLAGRALRASDEEFDRLTSAVADRGGELPPGRYPLFRLDLTDVSFLRPEGDHLVIEWWRPGAGVQRVERR